MKKNELYTTQLRQKAEQQMENTLPTDFTEKEMNILKLQHELEVYRIELQMQYDELISLNGKSDKLTAELAITNTELMVQLKEKDKRTEELLKKTNELQQFISFHTNNAIKMMNLENELKELLKNRETI